MPESSIKIPIVSQSIRIGTATFFEQWKCQRLQHHETKEIQSHWYFRESDRTTEFKITLEIGFRGGH